MNNLNIFNKEFNSENLSKYEFTISLIKECVRCEMLPQNYLYTVQIKIGDILKDLMIKLTKGESSSITVEKAEKLIIGIWYTIDAYMNSLINIEECVNCLKNEEISFMYEKGKEILKSDFAHTEDLYKKVLENKINTDLRAYNDTLEGIDNFFKLYNIDFEPDECDADIDYPLAIDDWNVKGVYYMKNYLWNLYIENEIVSKFENDEVKLVLSSYGDNYHIDYKDLLINIYEMTIINAVFSKLCNNKSLKISNEDFKILNNKLRKINKENIGILIKFVIDKIIDEYKFDKFEKEYIKKYEKTLIKETINSLKRNNLKNLLVITDTKKKKKKTITISEEKQLSDGEFKLVIEEILSCDNAYEKIDIISNKINSIKDYIDVLKSDCLFEDEYILLFMSLSNIELSILCKYVFYSEYRMEKLNIIKILSKDIEIKYEWEKFYLEYLKSLSDEKLKEIENIINFS